MFVLSLVLVAAVWELYKSVGPQDGGSVLGWRILPRAKDRVMPHVSDILSRFGDPISRSSDESVFSVVLRAVLYSFRLVLVGFAIGIVAGVLLAVVMTRFRIAARAILPYLVISQTIPLIALAPLIVSWGGKVHVGGLVWERWMSASLLGAFLSFFPIAVGTLRGLQSPSASSIELMDSLAAPWRRTLFKLRFPAAVPYMVPALKLGRRQRGDRRRRLGDLDRLARWDRPAGDRVRSGHDQRSGDRVHGGPRCRVPRADDGCARCAGRRRADAQSSSGGGGVNAVEVVGLKKIFNPVQEQPGRRAGRHRSRDSTRRVRDADRAVGLRQEHAAASDREPHRADGRDRSRSTARAPSRLGSTRTTGWRSSKPACSSGAPSPRTSSCRWS